MSIKYTTENTFIFTFARMNPPTPGHLFLIKEMIYKAIELNVEKIYILISNSMDGKNPLPCSADIPSAKNKGDAQVMKTIHDKPSYLMYKSQLLEIMVEKYKLELSAMEVDEDIKRKIENMRIIIKCSSGNPFAFIFDILNSDYDVINPDIKLNIFFFVGKDRSDFFDKMVNIFKKNIEEDGENSFIQSIDGKILEREGMEALKSGDVSKRSAEDIRPGEYSASFVRNVVKSGNRELFTNIYRPYLSREEINNLYETIQLGIRLKTPSTKEADGDYTSYYVKNGLLPVINDKTISRKRKANEISSVGGRKSRKPKSRKPKSRNTKRKRNGKKNV